MRLTDAEWTVMRAVWDAGANDAHPAAPAATSAREILDRIDAAALDASSAAGAAGAPESSGGRETGWAYTTVKTMLARLVEKGALAERKRGNVSLYKPRVTQEQARRSALRSLVDRAFDGAFGPLLQHIVTRERLSTQDRQTLQQMIAALDAPVTRPARGGADETHIVDGMADDARDTRSTDAVTRGTGDESRQTPRGKSAAGGAQPDTRARGRNRRAR